jgi:putative drug exporter of the RND superfamily
MRITKWLVLAVWLLVAVVAVPLAGRVSEIETNDMRNWLPASAESTRALDVADAEFADEEPEQLLVLYVRDGAITPGDKAAADADAARLAAIASAPMPPVVPSPDGQALLVRVPLTDAQVAENAVGAVLDKARLALGTRPAGLDAWLTGGPAISGDFDAAFESLDTRLLLVTVGVVALILLFTYRSPVLLLVPLAVVGVASQLANALVYLCGKHLGLVVDGASASILTVLLFGAGTDYALLLISRYREELTRHEDRQVAMWRAVRRTFSAVAASAVTVMLALLALVFAAMNSTRGLGPVGAIGIGAAFVAMVTLLPALLVLFGRWVFWPRVPRFGVASTSDSGAWHRVAGVVGRRPRPIWIGTALALGALAAGALALSTGLSPTGSFVTKPDSVLAAERLAVHFPAGSGTPTEVFTRADRRAAVMAAAANVPGVAEVREPSTGNSWVRVPVVLDDDADSIAAMATVERLRAAVHGADPAALVGGRSAQRLDQQSTMDRDLALVLPLILLVVFGVLVALLRAVLVPLLLLASVVLSYGAALGASALVFRALGYPTIDKSLLLNGFLFLVALGVDYTIFLMTRAREEMAVLGRRAGLPRALAVTGGVITSAGLVLAATFSVLTVMPLVFMMQLGILVAIGVLLDTFVVRSLLVPALVLDAGPRAWWPTRVAEVRPRPCSAEPSGSPEACAATAS